MEWVETTGRTVEAALDAALDQLGVHEDEVEFEVIHEPRSGLFGRRDARIRARVRPVSREKPGEQRRRPRRSSGGRSGTERRSRRGSSAGAGVDEATSAGGVGVAVGSAPAANGGSTGGSAKRSRRRGGRGRGGAERSEGARTAGSNGGRASPDGQEETVSEESVSVEEQAEAAVDFTRGLVTAFDVDAEVSTREEDDDVLIVDIDGKDLGLLVGPKGATLHAIEELVRTVVQRRTEGHGVRIHVDVAGYRAKRRAALERFALELAAEVRDSGEDRALEPMSASDRKVVHDAVATVDGVSTTSEGEEPRRRVVVRAG